MDTNEKIVQSITNAVMQELEKKNAAAPSAVAQSTKTSLQITFSQSGNPLIPVGISNRHLHITHEHLDILFGRDYQLTLRNNLSQRGEFAANETVTIVGRNGKFLSNVRILGPIRPYTQVEISKTDGYAIGILPPIRESGDINNTTSVTIIGPAGSTTLPNGLIRANRHIHLDPDSAAKLGVKDKQIVKVRSTSQKPTIFESVMIRIKDTFVPEIHLDTDDANAADLSNGDTVELLLKEEITYPNPTAITNERKKIIPAEKSKHTIITQKDIYIAKMNGIKEVIVPNDAIVTDIAHEYARREGIKITLQP